MTQTQHQRPLSPHLQIYRPQITSVLSILHRLTGVVLSVGLIGLTWMLFAAASGPESFAAFQKVASTKLAQIVLFGFTFAMNYHLCAGIRHLIMDMGIGFKIKELYLSGYTMLTATVLLTGGIWAYILGGF